MHLLTSFFENLIQGDDFLNSDNLFEVAFHTTMGNNPIGQKMTVLGTYGNCRNEYCCIDNTNILYENNTSEYTGGNVDGNSGGGYGGGGGDSDSGGGGGSGSGGGSGWGWPLVIKAGK